MCSRGKRLVDLALKAGSSGESALHDSRISIEDLEIILLPESESVNDHENLFNLYSYTEEIPYNVDDEVDENTDNMTEIVLEGRTANVTEIVLDGKTYNVTEPVLEERTGNVTEGVPEERTENVIEAVLEERTETEIVTEPMLEEKTGNVSEAVPEERTENVTEAVLEERTKNVTVNVTEDEERTEFGRRRSKRHLVDRKTWEKQKNKKRRLQGESYLGSKKSAEGKWKFSVQKNRRAIKSSCNCKRGARKLSMSCHLFSEKDRQDIFDAFWNIKSWEDKRTFIKDRVLYIPVMRRTKGSTEEPVEELDEELEIAEKENRKKVKNFSLVFRHFLNGQLVRVCKKFFLNTLDIGEWSVRNWVSQDVTSNNAEQNQIYSDSLNSRIGDKKRKASNFNTKTAPLTFLKKFLNDLNKLESHYCRKKSSKLYLEPIWNSKMSLYLQYKEECTANNEYTLSYTSFNKEFEEMNLSLFTPRKDQCDTCTSYKTKNLSEEEFQQHVSKKDLARKEKQKDKEDNNTKWVFTMDLQAVLLSPRMQTSALYYRMKLCVHNFTIFDLKMKQGFCYIWHEGEGQVTANEFSSILYNFVDGLDTEAGDEVILYSDGCAAQNRNVTLSNALSVLSKKNNIIIVQKFLEKGHTQMECDSMHATIEKKLKNRDIHLPSEYVTVCKNAKHEEPYKVEYLDFSYFYNFANINKYKSIRPGHKIGDPKVLDLRVLKYTPDGNIYFKLNHDDGPFTKLDQRLSSKKVCGTAADVLKPLYTMPLKINKTKYEHLQELKPYLPKDVHSFYDNLNHE